VAVNSTLLTHIGGITYRGNITALDGYNIVNVSAIDAAGNIVSNLSQNYTATPADTEAPVISLVVLSTHTPTTSQNVTVYANVTDNVGVTAVAVNSTLLTHIGGITYRGNITALDGYNIVNVSAIDAAGNIVSNLSQNYNATTPISDSNLSDFGAIVTTASRGGWLNTSVNVTNNGSAPQSYTILVSGVTTSGDSLVATGTIVNLGAGQTLNIPVIVAVPNAAAVGDYVLYAGLWKYEEFPTADKLIKTSTSLTVTVS